MLRIAGGEVYDPANGIDGEVRDICIDGGRIVSQVEGGRTIDASGMVVMPGGVDMHSHIAGPGVTAARMLHPEEQRSGSPSGLAWEGRIPTASETGCLYVAMGYTTVFDAAVPPLGARQAHQELGDIPMLDKGFLVSMGRHRFITRQIAAGDRERLRHAVAWLLQATGGFGIKVVNPGNVGTWTSLDHAAGSDATPRQIIQSLAQAAEDLSLSHPLHIHCNNLGVAGNRAATIETMKAFEGRRGHLAHIQFHSYGGDPGGPFKSGVRELVDYVNAHPNLSVDVGQVMFGGATSVTGDAPLARRLHRIGARKWINLDLENEDGCGVMPIEYRPEDHDNATQWAIGLEWLLLMRDPWRIALSTDHPNGASFLAYPRIIRLLMDREFRREALKRVNQKAIAGTCLPDIDREYSLGEIATITRGAPARILGLERKGHLGVGADADISIYARSGDKSNKEEMFARPRFVIKDGEIVVEDGRLRCGIPGRTFCVAPEYDRAIEKDLKEFFREQYTIAFENYPVRVERYAHRPERIACRRVSNS